MNIKDLTIEMIDEYADTLKLYKPKTLKNKLTPIRSFLAFMYSKNQMEIRKESVELPKVQELEANFLDPLEQEQIVNACFDIREKAVITFLIASGVRVSELINLRVDDVYCRSVLVRNGKGGKSRTTYITEAAEMVLDEYQSTIENGSQVWLFPNEQGARLSRQFIAKLVTRVARRAGIKKKVSPHTLRHTFATNLLMRGARAEDIQPMMGHTHIRTTQIYMHFTNSYLKQRYDMFATSDINVLA